LFTGEEEPVFGLFKKPKPENHSNQPGECPVCGLTRHQCRFEVRRHWSSALDDIVDTYWCQYCNSGFVWDNVTGEVRHVETHFPNGAGLKCMKGYGIAKKVDPVIEEFEENEKGYRVYVFVHGNAWHKKIPSHRHGYVRYEDSKIVLTPSDGKGDDEITFDAQTGSGEDYRIGESSLPESNILPKVKKALGI
jgi:hypothetical protein